MEIAQEVDVGEFEPDIRSNIVAAEQITMREIEPDLTEGPPGERWFLSCRRNFADPCFRARLLNIS